MCIFPSDIFRAYVKTKTPLMLNVYFVVDMEPKLFKILILGVKFSCVDLILIVVVTLSLATISNTIS